jgi:DNA invertase Pin-like site-specific DNA recombinase
MDLFADYQPRLIDLPRIVRLASVTPDEAAREVFGSAVAGTFFPLLTPRTGADGEAKLGPFCPVFCDAIDEYANALERAGNVPVYWNLASYRRSALRRDGQTFTFAKTSASALHGVFVDFDCGRKPGDDKWEEPGRLLLQTEVLDGVLSLIKQEVLPPFNLWANGSRGCYGVWLFDEPERNVNAAADEWKVVRQFFYRRGKHLAADELARAIIQPLKAPGALAGAIQYFVTDAPRISLELLRRWYEQHPHETDIVAGDDRLPWTRIELERFERAEETIRALKPPKVVHQMFRRTRKSSAAQKAGWLKARFEDMTKIVHARRSLSYSRRQFFRDFGSAVKAYEFALHGDPQQAYHVAREKASALNSLLPEPLSATKLDRLIYETKPDVHRKSEWIRVDLQITTLEAERLNLRALITPELRLKRTIADAEAKAERAERKAEQRRKKEERRLQEEQRKCARHQQDQAVAAQKLKVKRDEATVRGLRNAEIARMLLDGAPTSEITRTLGVHRQQVARVRRRIPAEEQVIQRKLKPGRKTGSK